MGFLHIGLWGGWGGGVGMSTFCYLAHMVDTAQLHVVCLWTHARCTPLVGWGGDVNVLSPVFFLHETNDMMFPCSRFIDFVAVTVEHLAIGSKTCVVASCVRFNHSFVSHGTQSGETKL